MTVGGWLIRACDSAIRMTVPLYCARYVEISGAGAVSSLLQDLCVSLDNAKDLEHASFNGTETGLNSSQASMVSKTCTLGLASLILCQSSQAAVSHEH